LTPQQLRSILDQYTSDGTLSLPANAFGPGELQTTLETFLPQDAELTLTGVTMETTADGVTVKGSGAVLPFTGMEAEAIFADQAGSPALVLTATKASGWTLAAAFSSLSDSFFKDLPIADAELRLSSIDTANPLTLSGKMGLGGSYDSVRWLLGDSPTLDVSGPIAMKGSIPVFSLTLPALKPLHLDILGDLTPTLQLTSRVSETGAALPGFGLAASIPLKGASIPLFLNLSAPRSELLFRADFTRAVGITLSDLGSYVGGADLSSFIPSTNGFPGVAGVAVLDFFLDATKRSIQSVTATVDVARDWQIIRGVALSRGAIRFSVTDPQAARLVTAALAGIVSWPNGTLAMGAALEKKAGGVTADLKATLTDGSVIHLADIIGFFIDANVDANLDLDQFQLDLAIPALDWALKTNLSGSWTLPLGFTSVALTGAAADLKRIAGNTTGTITAQANAAGIQFASSWDLKKSFTLTGRFPDINLNELGEKLTGTKLGASVPTIRIIEGNAKLTTASASRSPTTLAAQRLYTETGARMYDFVLTASATSDNRALGSAIFEVRRTATTNGFLAGMAVPQTWSPGDLFPPLAPLFSSLTFTNTGIVFSTITVERFSMPNLTMPVPSKIDPGVTVFTTLALKGDGFDQLAKLFRTSITLNLVGIIDSGAPLNSVIKASLPSLAQNNSVTFKELAVILKPGSGAFDLSAAVALTIGSEKLDVTGKGALATKPPSSSLELTVANWRYPFGIRGLIVTEVGIRIETKPNGVIIAMLGNFLIGVAPRQFRFLIAPKIIDFEVPAALLFELAPTENSLKLTDLIQQFTQLDLSRVPVLNGIAFKTISFFVVNDPTGFKIGTQTFQPGIRVKAGILFYDYEFDVDIAVNTSRGIYASGKLKQAINLGNGILVISEFSGGKEGPYFLIDTGAFASGVPMVDPEFHSLSSITHLSAVEPLEERHALLPGESAPYLELSGRVQLLKGSVQQAVYIRASKDTLDFQYNFNFVGVAAQLACQCSMDKMSLAAQAGFGFTLGIDLPALVIAGTTIIPAISLSGVSAGITLGVSMQLEPTFKGSISVGLKFTALGQSFSPSFDLDLVAMAGAIENLWNSIADWLKTNLTSLFSSILDTLENFAKAIADGFISFGKDVEAAAKAMAKFFEATAEDVIKALKEIGYAFEDICKAVAKAFNTAIDAIVDLAEDVWIAVKDGCSLSGASSKMVPAHFVLPPFPDQAGELSAAPRAPWNRALIDLVPLSAAQPILFHYYLNQQEIQLLMQTDPKVKSGLRALATQPGFDPVTTPVAALSAVLDRLRPGASPTLAESIESINRSLAPFLTLSYTEFLQTLRDAA